MTQTWNTCPRCRKSWPDETATPQLRHRTRTCEACLTTPRSRLKIAVTVLLGALFMLGGAAALYASWRYPVECQRVETVRRDEVVLLGKIGKPSRDVAVCTQWRRYDRYTGATILTGSR